MIDLAYILFIISLRLVFPPEYTQPMSNFITGTLHDLQVKLGLKKEGEDDVNNQEEPQRNQEVVVQVQNDGQPYHRPPNPN